MKIAFKFLPLKKHIQVNMMKIWQKYDTKIIMMVINFLKN